MADATYTIGLEELAEQDWSAATIKVLLLEQTPAFDAAHGTVAAVLADAGNTELSGTGYERKEVPTRTVTSDAGEATLDHGDIVYTALDAGEVGAAVYYREVTDDSDSPVWFFKDSAFPFTSNGGDLTYSTGASGLVTLADAA